MPANSTTDTDTHTIIDIGDTIVNLIMYRKIYEEDDLMIDQLT